MPVTIKTLHGRIHFKVQRFIDITKSADQEQSYFDLTGQFPDVYITPRLQELTAHYSTLLSYKEVDHLIVRMTGEKQISDQKAWQIVNDKAVEISQSWPTQTEKTLNDPQWSFPKIQGDIDLYDPASREVLVLEDAIQVRGQKENRVRKQFIKEYKVHNSVENPREAVQKEKSPAVFTNIAML